MSLKEHEANSYYSVPLNPFPQGLAWSDVNGLLRDALDDLRKRWVREYLLKEDALFDAAILNDPSKMMQTFPLVFQASALENMSGGFGASVHNIRLNWPSFSIGQIGAGISVETSGGVGSHKVIFSRPWRFHRYVANAKRSCQLSLAFREEFGTVECTFMRCLRNGLWSYALLIFNLDIFRSAFSQGADFDMAHTGLVQSIIGGVQRKYDITNLSGRYPYKIFDNNGRHFFHSVITSYMNKEPMMTIPIFAEGHWSFDIDAAKLVILQKWGMNNRLRRITLTPTSMPEPNSHTLLDPPQKSSGVQTGVPSTEIIGQNTSNRQLASLQPWSASRALAPSTASFPHVHRSNISGENDERAQKSPQTKKGLKSIAPAPISEPREMSQAEKQELERQEKLVRRKIQKREAAARYNTRKRLELEEKRRLEDKSSSH